MTSAVFDFKDIHMRMRGDCKQQPVCWRCVGGGWIETYSVINFPPGFEVCPLCFNPEGHPSP